MIRRLDDRLDPIEAIVENLPSMAAMNNKSQVTGASPDKDPNAQGGRGGDARTEPRQINAAPRAAPPPSPV